MFRPVVFAVALASPYAALAQHGAQSPYAGQQHREIKALSADEVSGYLEGKGMGLARAAELNGYPGPMHVLELADQLSLTPEQRSRTQALFDDMKRRAVDAGRALVAEERALDALFSSRAATPDKLADALARIGQRQADVRRVHLEAHLAQIQLLQEQQVRRYAALRGYSGSGHGGAGSHADHRH
jgi:Spy/CpxP family protein refolding chaperone